MARSMIKIEPFLHPNQTCIALRFDYNREIIDKVKTINEARWSATNKCWYMPEINNYQEIIESAIGDFASLEFNFGANNTDKGITVDFKEKQITSKAENVVIRVNCDERQKTFYLNLPFQFKDEFKKLEGAWWHPGAKLWSVLGS